jgi:carbonic anhydrase
MKTAAPQNTHPLRTVCQPLLLALGLPLLASVHAAGKPDSANAPVLIENPQERAALAARITEALERANEKHTKKEKGAGQHRVASMTVQVTSAAAKPAKTPPAARSVVSDPGASRRYILARAAALTASAPPALAPPRPPEPDPRQVRWSYQGDTGPQAWGQLHSSFATCDKGERQSPLHITAQDTVAGPAEPLQPGAQVFGGTVAHTGHGIELEVEGESTLTLRGIPYRLARLQFHHPAEDKIRHKRFPMATDLLYQGPEGQLAVVSVPMQLGSANPFIARIWPHLPLGAGDRVALPTAPLQLHELLPQDRRTYQYQGSLTTPPCTEGVLRVVMKTPVNVGQEQLRLLARLAPDNARPTQPAQGRVVREAQ